MTEGDLDFAARCIADEEWSAETPNEFEAFLEHDRAGCLVAEARGERAGICVASFYPSGHAGCALGFIGMLIVRPELRGRGIGRQLLDEGIGHLRSRGAASVQLDGVSLAVPLYERAGFRRCCRSLRSYGEVRGARHPKIRPMAEADLQAVCALDLEAFGADRSYFLRRRLRLFSHLCRVYVEGDQVTGFTVGRGGEDVRGRWSAAGPLLPSDDPSSAEALLRSIPEPGEQVTLNVNVLDTCQPATALLDGMGFGRREDPPWRMALTLGGPDGVERPGLSTRFWAIGPPGKG